MFTLYLNDLPVHLHQFSIHMYADDTIIYFISQDKYKYDCSTLSLLQQLNWLSVYERIKFCTALLVYKCINNMAPENLASLFKFGGNNRNYSLHNVRKDLIIPKPMTETHLAIWEV